ncbi:hypothetical protein PU629_13620 [Pullulanibacillus sp. KACC 23026]|uniref:hypothetical protein n=1 Tax=Pullulanibacillus sp. KACC 23026 TaxID=3028315 RepID=UPI0023AEA13D|nr:hypothetical protein [Pullulanibacillus sp. KACC 23026]WEG11201.1 hypothetical protein PU629_13620 [Pullulanibacillus sp. KACC 23026]
MFSFRKKGKQFKIKVNHHSVKILEYKKEIYCDDFRGEEVKTIELVTKRPIDVLDQKEVVIQINHEPAISADWLMHITQPDLHSYLYRVR